MAARADPPGWGWGSHKRHSTHISKKIFATNISKKQRSGLTPPTQVDDARVNGPKGPEDMLSDHGSMENYRIVTAALVDTALQSGSTDNVSCVIVYFPRPPPAAQSSLRGGPQGNEWATDIIPIFGIIQNL